MLFDISPVLFGLSPVTFDISGVLFEIALPTTLPYSQLGIYIITSYLVHPHWVTVLGVGCFKYHSSSYTFNTEVKIWFSAILAETHPSQGLKHVTLS